VDDIRETRVLTTYLAGKPVHGARLRENR